MSRPPIFIRFGSWIGERVNRLGDAWNRLVEPIEIAFAWLGDRFFSAFDSFKTLELVVVRVVAILLWPLTATFGWLSRFLPAPTEDGRGWATLPGRTFDRFVGSALWAAEKLNLDGFLLVLVRLLTPMWWPCLTLLGFCSAWLMTRRWRELALAAPALTLAAPFAYVAVEGGNQSQGVIADRYKSAVREALRVGGQEKVFLFERKLAQLGVDTRRADFRNAIALADEGKLDRAYARMSRLASAERPGYPQAHAWIVQALITGRLTAAEEPLLKNEQERCRLAHAHLGHLAEVAGGGQQVTQLRAYTLAAEERYAEG